MGNWTECHHGSDKNVKETGAKSTILTNYMPCYACSLSEKELYNTTEQTFLTSNGELEIHPQIYGNEEELKNCEFEIITAA